MTKQPTTARTSVLQLYRSMRTRELRALQAAFVLDLEAAATQPPAARRAAVDFIGRRLKLLHRALNERQR